MNVDQIKEQITEAIEHTRHAENLFIDTLRTDAALVSTQIAQAKLLTAIVETLLKIYGETERMK